MEKSEMTTLLSLLNIDTNKWIRVPSLRKIILNLDGNQFYNVKLQKLYFDTTNSLIEVKYSRLMPCSSSISNFSYNAKNNSLIFNDLLSQSIYIKKVFREPIVGDLIGCYDPNTKEYAYSKIKSLSFSGYDKVITMADNKIITKIEAAKYGMKYFILLQDYENPIMIDNPAELFYEQDTTKYKADVYIDFEYVEGFDFDQVWA